MRQYFRNLKLWACGIRWLWTRELTMGPAGYYAKGDRIVSVNVGIHYKPGWSPWKFLPLYLTDYLAACLLGYGVVSLSRAWYDRSRNGGHPFAAWMTRALNWAFPGKLHGMQTGGRLWGSVNLRD